MLRKIRITLAIVFLVMLTFLFVDFTGLAHTYFKWTASIQFWPAILSINVGIIIFLVLLTLLFGRIYCSVICPLGIIQDVISYFSGKRKKKKARFSYSKPKNILRYSILAFFALLFVLGLGSIAAIIEPYSIFGRFFQTVISPCYVWINNCLAQLAEHYDSYLFYDTEVLLANGMVFGVAIIVFVTVMFLAWKNGREYCNTVCPVGSLLGLLSKYSLFKPVIDADKCIECGICSRKCKASCIDGKNRKIDYSRCVTCFDCIESCKHNAISYRIGLDKKLSVTDKGRRSTLSILGMIFAAGIAKGEEKKIAELAPIVDKKPNKKRGIILPAGAESLEHYKNNCISCMACVNACDYKVLRPSGNLEMLLQPTLHFEENYCHIDCVKCSEVCPTDAIKPVTLAEKSSIRVGHAVWIKDNCVVIGDGKSCGNCARHCPTGAIEMIKLNPEDENSLEIPSINKERCIGCGTCESLCPSRPVSAIFVKGFSNHKTM